MVSKLLKKLIARIVKIGLEEIQSQDYQKFRKKYGIPASFRFNGDSILFYGSGQLLIGDNSYIGSYSTIQINAGNKVMIGRNCKISHNVRIYTTTALSEQIFDGDTKAVSKSEDVIIGNGVWIGANVFINPGISIGDNAIVGANSVVTRNVESNAIVGGVPAKFIRSKNL